jgi:hypothetical protein
MPSELLFKTKNRDESHAKLAEIIKAEKHRAAECREDIGDPNGECYQVWSGPVFRAVDPVAATKELSPDQLSDLAELIAQKMKG